MDKKNNTIKDIADLAGVSKGTVDRVLHNRGKVSKKALTAVNNVLDKVNYTPNVLARNLKKNKVYHITVVLPNPKIDKYWSFGEKGIMKAIDEFASFDLKIETICFNPESPSSFVESCKLSVNKNPDAIVLAPLFRNEAVQFVKTLKGKNIIIGTFNNQIDTHQISCFVGQNLFHSGRVAGKLLNSLTNQDLVIVHIDETVNNAVHMLQKEAGFRSYFKDKNLEYKVYTLKIQGKDSQATLLDFLTTHPNVKGVFVTTSKAYKIFPILKNSDIYSVGYDLIKKNIKGLKEDTIDFLIHQRPTHQVYLSLVYLAEKFLFEKPVPKSVFLSIDILNSENVDSYTTNLLF